MKIVVNTRLLQKNKLDGIGVFTHEIFSRMVKNHPQHTFYFLFDHKPDADFIYAKNVIPLAIYPPTKTPMLYKIWFQVQVPRILKKINPDIFISPDGNIPLNTKVKTINVIHDLNFEHFPQYLPAKWRKYYKKYFPEFARNCTKLITVSNYSKQDIVSTYHIDTEKINVVYNAAADYFKPLTEEQKNSVRRQYASNNPYFIFVGSLHPRKNIVTLLRAFDELKNRNNSTHKLILAGKKMWWTNEMEQVYSNLKHKNEVIFTGRIPNEELSRLLAASDGLVYIPHFEGFGIPVLEAFKSRVPVICSNNTSLPEVAGDAAILVSPENISEIANAMHLLAENRELKENLINKGTERLNQFSWDKSAIDFWNIIEKTAKC